MLTISKALLVLGSSLLACVATVQAAESEITVYKSPTCGCCSKWVDHLKKNGIDVETRDVHDLSRIKFMAGVNPKLASCHTAMVDGYVIEGHVPADDIKRLLRERPQVRGLAVPGMPHGSPGMESGRKDPFQVLSFDAEGKTAVFAQH